MARYAGSADEVAMRARKFTGDESERGTTPIVCAWCGFVLVQGHGPVSHGICPDCQMDFAGEVDRYIRVQ